MIAAPPAHALAQAAGLDLSSYRDEHVDERVRRALVREAVPDVDALARRLRRDAVARSRFRASVAISVSGMFRDPEQFDLLEREVLPELAARGRRFPVWSAGCADGSELYSVAVLLERLGALERALLLGSDVLEENLAVARAAAYLEPELRVRLRDRTRWERRDIVSEGAPGGKWSLVLCRNVAIYLNSDARARLYASLAASVGAGGFLVLGRSERLASPHRLGLEPAWPHVYRRSPS